MENKRRPGRPTEVTAEPIQSKFLRFQASRKYHVTVRSVELWLKEECGTASKASAQKLMQSEGCRRVRVNVKPILLHKHMVSRFHYCWKRLDELRRFKICNELSSDVEIFVDEKWFNKLTLGSYMWLTENVIMENASEFWRRKSYIPKIMYFAAIAQPRPELNLDVTILFKPLLQEVKAKRTSAVRSVGNIMLQTTQMD